MTSRHVIASLLIVCGAATVAYADVSLTDQQTFVSAPLAEGQVPRLIDATGLEWFINDEVTYATASSAVGAASDAAFVAAVEASTAAGGTELSVLADAFDGYNALRVSVNGAAPVMFNQTGGATSDCNGRQVITTSTIQGVEIIRKIYVPGTDGFARWLNVVRNTSGLNANINLTMLSNLGSDARTKIWSTSSGDKIATLQDSWITSFEDFVNGSSRAPRLAHVLQSPNAVIPLSGLTFADGNDQPTWSYAFSLAPGHSAVIWNFAAGLANRQDATQKAAQLAALPPAALACTTADELAAPSNVVPGVLPSGPEPTGPGAIQITYPTTEENFGASTPFVSLGGIAGPARLTRVVWSSNRGPSGIAQGLTEWAIPSAALLPGNNVFTVTAEYEGLPSFTDTITVNLAATAYVVPEGSTGTFFSTDLLIANPTDAPVEANIRLLTETSGDISLGDQLLPAMSRTTIRVDDLPGLAALGAFSSVVTSLTGAPLIVEQSTFWDSTSYGSHGAAAIEGARNKFLFSEGSQGFFETFLLLANPNGVAADVTVSFLREGNLPISKPFTLEPNSRTSVSAGTIPELVNTSFSIVVDSNLPIVAERSMYFGRPEFGSRTFEGGHDSPGVSLATTQWNFAEGASGTFFDTFYLLGNAGSRAADVTFKYQLAGGGTVTTNHVVPAFGRLTVNAATDHPQLAATAFSLALVSSEPITAERSMYWGRTATTHWIEAHNVFGVNQPGTRWGLAEGRTGGDRQFQTFILIGNSSNSASDVRVTFLRAGGGATIEKQFTIAANSRFNVDVSGMVPELANQEFGAIVEVLAGAPVIVERALYSNSGGVLFAAGTASPAVRLP
jgi:hypothetical protein